MLQDTKKAYTGARPSYFPFLSDAVLQCLVSVKRIVKFFKCEDLDDNNVIIDDRAG